MALPFVDTPAFLAALRYVREDVIGKVTGVEADLSFPGPPRSNWYYTKAISHGGAMLDTAPYPLTRIATVLGPARRVAAFANTLIPQRICGDGGRVHSDVDDNVTLLLEYEGGQQASIRSCWAYSYMDRSIVVHGRHGDVFWNTAGERLIVRSTRQPVPDAEPVTFLGLDCCYRPAIPPQDAQGDVVAEFVRCIRSGECPTAHGRLALHVIEQLMKAYESAQSGRVLTLETTFESWWHPEPGLFDLKHQWL
jgi:predicted dehydrogenase